MAHPAGRRAPRAALPLLTLVLLGALGLALGQTAPDPAPSSIITITPDTARPVAQPVVARPIESTPTVPGSARDSSGGPNDPPVAAAATASDTTSLQTRWVAEWANMRRLPSNEAPVVRVLPPGTMVRGTPSKWGWWAIQYQGDTVGYVAGSLLRPSRPPGTTARPPADR